MCRFPRKHRPRQRRRRADHERSPPKHARTVAYCILRTHDQFDPSVLCVRLWNDGEVYDAIAWSRGGCHVAVAHRRLREQVGRRRAELAGRQPAGANLGHRRQGGPGSSSVGNGHERCRPGANTIRGRRPEGARRPSVGDEQLSHTIRQIDGPSAGPIQNRLKTACFDIEVDNAARSGLDQYDADAGFKDAGIDLVLGFGQGLGWRASLIGRYRRC